MSNRDAIAVIEFSLELDHFFNIDLYVGGYYQLRCQLKTAKKVPSKIEVSIPRAAAPQVFPASVVNGKAVGTAFEILYKEEDITLKDMVEYKAFVPLKMSKLPNVLQFHLSLELWYIDKDEMLRKATSDVYTSFECVSKRHLVLNFPLFRGLHYHRPVVFDYFHLCATTLTVHGSLVALEKTTLAANVAFASKQHLRPTSSSTTPGEKPKSYSTNTLAPNSSFTSTGSAESANSTSSTPRQNSANSLAPSPDSSRRFVAGSANLTTFEEAVFGAIAKTSSSGPQRLQNAYQFHRSVCRLLLTAYEALELKLTQLLHCLPSRYQIRIQSVDCAKKFEILQQNIQRLEDESELLSAIDGNVALLSGELTMLWRQFLELFRGRDEIRHRMAKEHHTSRVRRLAEGFFSGSECASTSTLIDFGNVGRQEKTCERLEEQLRKSNYFQFLPPLGVYCDDLDGNPELLPVVFEQRYQPAMAPSTPPLDSEEANDDDEEDDEESKSTRMKHSQSAKIANALARVFDNEAKKKDLLKGTLSLDLPHVHRPAKQQLKIAAAAANETAALKSTSTSEPETSQGHSQEKQQQHSTKWKSTRTGSCRKPLFSRSASFRLWRRQRRLHTFPLANSELGKYENSNSTNRSSSSSSIIDHQKRALVHCSRIFRSAPDLKSNPAPTNAIGRSSVDVDRISVNLRDNDRSSLTTAASYFEEVFRMSDNKTTEATRTRFGCLNCCHPGDLSTMNEPECTEETVATVVVDNGHEETKKEKPDTTSKSGIVNRRTSSISGDEDERQVGVSFGLDALALENERNLIVSPGQMPASADSVPRLTSGIEQELLEFVSSKEHYKQRMRDAGYDGHLCSDFAAFPSTVPYFLRWNNLDYARGGDLHLIVCVHGLDGTCADLRMVRAYIELCLPDKKIDFLMSKRNQMDTFNDFETMTRNLVDELLLYLSHCSVHPTRISFIGHSLGNVIIRSALADPRLEPWLERLYTFLSLNGPHCGILYNNNSMVNMGIWFVQRWKKSVSLQQMALKDNTDLRQTFMYQLSTKPCLQYFKYVLLVGSHDDFYVPMHSALIQVCRSAMKDTTLLGQVYTEIIHNIMLPLLNGGRTTVVRYSVFHAQQASSTTSHLLGRAAHIAVLDSDLFIEKLLTVSALRYFR